VSLRLAVESFLAAQVIRLLGSTWRIRVVHPEREAQARARGRPVIYTFWHGRLLPLSFTHRGRAIQVLASIHRDGERMGRTIRHLGFGHLRGSSTRGGTEALRRLVGRVRAGYDLGLTVDGPRGPRHVVKMGAVAVAWMTGAALLPVATAGRRRWVFSSWDRFEVPRPFTEVVIHYGEPLWVPPEVDREELETYRVELEGRLRRITEEADGEVRG
jgi:hypothetical protein